MSYPQSSAGLVCGWDNCGRKFSVLKNLVTHLSDDHVGFKKEKYSCRWVDCPRSHSTQSSRFALISHLRSHTGEKPYICPAPSCPREFTRSDSLNKHIRTTHPENAFPKAESLYGSSQPDSDQGYGDSLQESIEKASSSRSRQASRREPVYQNLFEQDSPVTSQRYLNPAIHKLSKPQQLTRQVFETSRESGLSRTSISVEGSLNSQQKYSLLKAKLLFIQDEREAFREQIKEKKEKVRLLEAEKHLLLSSLIRTKVKLDKQATKRQEKKEKRKLSKLSASDSKKSKKKAIFTPKRRKIAA
ncbi:hypothetical protein DSO57_1029850 [Entomophthora muscae]|uniref:Uncharacterized protein n=1 Tax=Entomophthora muscae TaxID=34485 RepID=A0ACC2S375_9FUNG|nr:hypothetical protein DSO57_1029850 [Entomophthora muscae]